MPKFDPLERVGSSGVITNFQLPEYTQGRSINRKRVIVEAEGDTWEFTVRIHDGLLEATARKLQRDGIILKSSFGNRTPPAVVKAFKAKLAKEIVIRNV